jgi:hypothetical protein
MRTTKVSDLFHVEYGDSLELYLMQETSAGDMEGINFISRTRENNGVSAVVKPIPDIEPFPEGLITVAGSGNSVLESFIQPKPFYTGFHVFVLRPKKIMTEVQKLFYCHCIRENRYKYNFGRQANRTLKDLKVPKILPANFASVQIDNLVKISDESLIKKTINLDSKKWKTFTISSLFIIAKGKEIINKCQPGYYPIISAVGSNNGVTDFGSGKKVFNKYCITIASNGASTGEAFYQEKDFIATSDVNILTPKFKINIYSGLFLCTVFRLEKYRFNYGRKWSKERMESDRIKLPALINGGPDWKFMERYIKSLPYSSTIQQYKA